MSTLRNISADLNAVKRFSLSNKIITFFFNRGFHALLFYRIANVCYRFKIPIVPLVLTRVIQIFYAIDIDYKATIEGGVVIVHGVGLVVGSGVKIGSNAIIFHGVTMGRRGVGPVISQTDGFPEIGQNCILCTGAVMLGQIRIGENSTIGANCLITRDVAANSICKLPDDHFIIYNKK